MNDKILEVRQLKKYFKISGRGKHAMFVRAVSGVSFDISQGETLGLVGESGSGKSTIAYTIMGMYAPTSGDILYKGEPLAGMASKRPLRLKKELQIVFQDPGSSLNPRQTIKQILGMNLRLHRRELQGREELETEMVQLLQKVELPADYLYKSPPSIGGGERQMIGVARALAANPSVIVLDEPTSALDVSVQAKVISKLQELQREMELTFLFITHDLSLMRNVATRVAIMYLGKICELATAEEFFKNPLHPYTRMLLSSIPTVSAEEESLKPARIASIGEIPSPVNVPPGCSFHMRCPERKDRCAVEAPEMREASRGHFVSCHLC